MTCIKEKKNDNFSDEALKQYSNQAIEYERESSQSCFSASQTKTRGEKDSITYHSSP